MRQAPWESKCESKASHFRRPAPASKGMDSVTQALLKEGAHLVQEVLLILVLLSLVE